MSAMEHRYCHEQLTKIPEALLDIKDQVISLDLGHNYIEDISELAGFVNLTTLRLHHNMIKDISPLAALKKLKVLDLSFNDIEEVFTLNDLEELEEVDLSYNKLGYFPLRLFYRLVDKEKLDLSVNPFYPEFDKADDYINSIPWLRAIANKHHEFEDDKNFKLDLTGMGLKKFPLEILDLKELEELDLRNNEIEIFPFWYFNREKTWEIKDSAYPELFYKDNFLPNLKKLWLDADTVKGLDKNELGDPEGLVRILRGEVKLEKGIFGKLVLLGNTGTGKTNLQEMLRNGLSAYQADHHSTHGIKVPHWEIPNKDVTVSIWDFGGQEYYHATHRLFLSPDTHYLVVWSADDNANVKKTETSVIREGDIEGSSQVANNFGEAIHETWHFDYHYWLFAARYFGGGNSRIWVLQNKIDKSLPDKDASGYMLAKFGIPTQALEKYEIDKQAQLSLAQSHEKPKGFMARRFQLFQDELEEGLVEDIQQRKFREYYKPIFEKLAKEKLELILSVGGFLEIVEKWVSTFDTIKEGVDLVKYLRGAGWILCYDEEPTGESIVYTNPIEITKQIYQLLQLGVRKRVGYYAEGEFDYPRYKANFEEYKAWWEKQVKARKEELGKPEFLDTDKFDMFVDLMRKFEIIFDCPTKKDTYIAPQYLPLRGDDTLFDIATTGMQSPTLTIRYAGYFSNTFIMRYIVSRASKGQGEKQTPHRYWADSVIHTSHYEGKTYKIWVDSNIRSKTIHVHISGEGDTGAVAADIFKYFKEMYLLRGKLETDFSNSEVLKRTIELEEQRMERGLLGDLSVSLDGEYFAQTTDLEAASKDSKFIPLTSANGSKKEVNVYDFRAFIKDGINLKPPKKVFISYSKHDRQHLDRLLKHLNPLKKDNRVVPWEDSQLIPGEEWDDKIKKQLDEADIILLLVSADFLGTEYIWDVEIKKAIERHNEAQANPSGKAMSVVPVILNHCDWTETPFAGLNAIPQKGTPILSYPNPELGYLEVVIEMKKLLDI